MDYSEQIELFNRLRAKHSVFLLSILWKLTGDRELFAEAMQYTLLGIWQHIGKLNGKKAQSYIYRIALSSNSKAWRNRIGRNGQISTNLVSSLKGPDEKADRIERAAIVRRAISELPTKQARAIVMRYLEQHDYDAIATKLCCSESGARSHVSKAVAALKKKLTTLAKQGE